MAGSAGPGHLKAAHGHLLTGILGVEVRDGPLILRPGLLTGRRRGGHVVQGILWVGAALFVKVVGVVGEGHEVHIGALRQARHIAQGGLQTTGTVGVGGVGVELAEVFLILGLAHGEAPAHTGALPILPYDGDGGGPAAVGHLLCRGIGDLIAVDRHVNGIRHRGGTVLQGQLDSGTLPRVGDLRGNQGCFSSPVWLLGAGVMLEMTGSSFTVISAEPEMAVPFRSVPLTVMVSVPSVRLAAGMV